MGPAFLQFFGLRLLQGTHRFRLPQAKRVLAVMPQARRLLRRAESTIGLGARTVPLGRPATLGSTHRESHDLRPSPIRLAELRLPFPIIPIADAFDVVGEAREPGAVTQLHLCLGDELEAFVGFGREFLAVQTTKIWGVLGV